LWEAIDEYRHAERIKTEIEAIRRLLELGLEAAARGGQAKREVRRRRT
jgi:hypothetical protein